VSDQAVRSAKSGAPVWSGIAPSAVLSALPDPILVIDIEDRIRFANPSAEQFFSAGASLLSRYRLVDLVPFGSPLLSLLQQVRTSGATVSEYDVDLSTPRNPRKPVDIRVTPVVETAGSVLIVLQERSIAEAMDQQISQRGAARSVTGMAGVLAHEVKNPLSGIRGAAQLLEQNASVGDRELTRLIREETDRICALVDRMEAFSDGRPIQREPVNIHRILEHVRRVAQHGFGQAVRFIESYDPSLPPVYGNRDQLIQVFLNLVKNACEAVPQEGGEVVLHTSFRHGVHLAVAGNRNRLKLPLQVTIQDNGDGVPEDLKPHMFDPFVTTKPKGTGLGLALVAKLVGDHGGVIECESRPRRTVFRVLLPIATGPGKEAES
jgi:two-component system, NtrC family, nitrogen regulation sensor histidine kinase GlnL